MRFVGLKCKRVFWLCSTALACDHQESDTEQQTFKMPRKFTKMETDSDSDDYDFDVSKFG